MSLTRDAAEIDKDRLRIFFGRNEKLCDKVDPNLQLFFLLHFKMGGINKPGSECVVS